MGLGVGGALLDRLLFTEVTGMYGFFVLSFAGAVPAKLSNI